MHRYIHAYVRTYIATILKSIASVRLHLHVREVSWGEGGRWKREKRDNGLTSLARVF